MAIPRVHTYVQIAGYVYHQAADTPLLHPLHKDFSFFGYTSNVYLFFYHNIITFIFSLLYLCFQCVSMLYFKYKAATYLMYIP